MTNIQQRLSIITNIVVIVVDVVAISLLAVRYTASSSDLPKALRPGETIPTLQILDIKEQSQTLLLFVKNGCHFCDDSMPFYRRLNDVTRAPGSTTRFVALFPDSNDAAQKVLDMYSIVGINFSGGIKFDEFSVSGTPTLILVDRNARIKRTWVGQLNGAEEQVVLRLVSPSS